MHGFKLFDIFKSTQVHALSPQDNNSSSRGKLSKSKFTNSGSGAQALLAYGLPTTELLEPTIDFYLKPIDYVESLAEIHRRLNTCSLTDKSILCIEQYSILRGLGDPKLLRRCLCAARQYAFDVHSKAVLSAWLRFERREDDFIVVSSKDCSGYILECPMAALVSGYDPNSIYDRCQCGQDDLEAFSSQMLVGNESSSLEEDGDVSFCIGDELVHCVRFKIASLSGPFKAMLYGSFVESRRDKIDFSKTGISVEGMRAVTHPLPVKCSSHWRRIDLGWVEGLGAHEHEYFVYWRLEIARQTRWRGENSEESVNFVNFVKLGKLGLSLPSLLIFKVFTRFNTLYLC